jgi:hypothetical protein
MINDTIALSMDETYYLAGPMTGRPQFNFPMFNAVASMLRIQGFNIMSPAELDDPLIRDLAMESAEGDDTINTDSWGDFLSRDVKIVADEVDGVICLPGWEPSKGARLEVFVAVCQGKDVYEYDPMEHTVLRIGAQYIGSVFRDFADQYYADT